VFKNITRQVCKREPWKLDIKKLKADKEERILFKKKIGRYKTENKPIIYIDGSGFEEETLRMLGYADIRKRCYNIVK
jgi:hypothetical protein